MKCDGGNCERYVRSLVRIVVCSCAAMEAEAGPIIETLNLKPDDETWWVCAWTVM